MAVTFGIEPDRINANSAQNQVPEWDSVAHLNLMLALEDTFNVRLTVQDMQRLTSVPDILRHLEDR
jgi:acyl carrier protein